MHYFYSLKDSYICTKQINHIHPPRAPTQFFFRSSYSSLFLLITHWVKFILLTCSWTCGYPLGHEKCTRGHTSKGSYLHSSHQLSISNSNIHAEILSALILCRFSKDSFCWELKHATGISTPEICFSKLSSPWNVSYIFVCLFFIEVIWALIFKCCIISKSPRFNEIYSKLWNTFLSQWRNTLGCVFETEETE